MGDGNKRGPAAGGFKKGGAVGAEHEVIVATDRWASWPNADSGVECVATAELDTGRLDIRADSSGVMANHGTSLIHFF